MPIIAPTKPIDEADAPDRDRRHVDLGALEAHLQRQAVDPGMACRRRRSVTGSPRCARSDGAHALIDHQRADRGQQHHVGHADGQIELAERAQHA